MRTESKGKMNNQSQKKQLLCARLLILNLVCVEATGDCGIPLGKYHLMSNDDAVRASISSVDGGDKFLAGLNNGVKPTPEEVFQYFPPLAQNQLFQESLAREVIATSQQVAITTGQLFTGDRLVARVAQKHYGGAASKVDSNSAPIDGGYSVARYGEQVAQLYHQQRVSSLYPAYKSQLVTVLKDTPNNKNILANFQRTSLMALKIFLSFGLVKVPNLFGYRTSKFNYRFLLSLGVILTLVIAGVF